MGSLHFNTPEEFTSTFKQKNTEVTNAIVAGIQKAMEERKTTALLFSITFEEHDNLYEISLPQSQWITALASCLDFYHREEMSDAAIDTWKLMEVAKVL